MKLTVLGKSPAWADGDGACSGYLVQTEKTSVLVDCGHGVVGKLRQHTEPHELNAVFISHLHADHVADLTAAAYALKFMPHERSGHRPLLILPAGGAQTLRRMAALWDGGEMFAEAFFTCEVGQLDSSWRVGDVTLRWAAVPHAVITNALDVAADDGSRFTYSADCEPNTNLTALAQNTPLLLCEATVPEPFPGHMTAAQAGQTAADCNAGQLMLTHFTDVYDLEWVRAQASEKFDGPVALAENGLVVSLV
jgi:ribonuclease BN (tRNA processing enzyme)